MPNKVLLCDASAGDAYVEYDLGADVHLLWAAANMWVPGAFRDLIEAGPDPSEANANKPVFLDLLDAAHVARARVWLQKDGITTDVFDPTPLTPTPADGWHTYTLKYDDGPVGFGGYFWGQEFRKDTRGGGAAGLSHLSSQPIRYIRLGLEGVSRIGDDIATGSGPTAIAITPDGTKAYVTNLYDGTVTPIDLATGTPGAAIAVGSSPYSVAITPDGTKAYVCNADDGTVTPIDVATDTPGAPIAVGASPYSVAFTPDGTKAYVANYGDDTVTPIDVATDTAGAPIAVGGGPYALAFTPDSAKAYVANFDDSTVTPIDVATDTPGAPIAVGASPDGVAISPDGTTAYVACYGADAVAPIDVATDTAGGAFSVGSSPYGVAFAPDGVTAYVTNQAADTVTPVFTSTPDARAYFEQFRVATAVRFSDAGMGGDDVWALTDFEGGFFGPGSDAGVTVVGDCSIVDDPDPADAGDVDYSIHGAAPQPDPTTTPRSAAKVATPFDSEVSSGIGHYINRIRNGGADGKTDVALLNTFFDSVTDEIAVAGADGVWAGSGAPFGHGAFDAIYLAPHDRWVLGGYHQGGSGAIMTSPDLSPGSFTARAGLSAYSQVTGLAYDPDADIVVAVGAFSEDDFATFAVVAYSTDGGITWTAVSTPWDGQFFSAPAVAFSPTLGWAAIAQAPPGTPAILTAPDPTGAWTHAPSDWDDVGNPTDIEWLPAAEKLAIVGSTIELDGVDGSPTFAASLSADGASWPLSQTAFDGGPGTPTPGTAGTAYGIVETPEGIYIVGWSTAAAGEAVLALSTDGGDTFAAALDDVGAPVSTGDPYFQAGTAICYRAADDILWVGGGSIMDDLGITGPMVRMELAPAPPPPSRRGLCIAPTAAWDDPDPEWIRLDGLDAPRRLTSWNINRGRSKELDKTETGTSVWEIVDRDGTFDTTVPGGLAGEGGFDPLRQAQVMIRNPCTETESSLFKGFIDELDVLMDVAARRADVTLNLVDGFGVMADLEMHPTDPPRFGTTPALESAAQIYFPPTDDDPDYNGTWGYEVNARIHRALDQAGWPADLRFIASGNENLQGAVYGRYDSLLSVIFDAAEAEFPGGVANAYMSKAGFACFHGRYLRFNAGAYLAASDALRRHGHPLVRWKAGGVAAADADPDVALLAGIRFSRGLSDIFNVATVLPQNVEFSDVPHALIKNNASIERFGWRPVSYEDLLVLRGVTSGLTAVEECKNFARFYVTNYKDPQTRVTQLIFRPRDPRSFSGPATWELMCGVDIGDPIDLDTEHWGGLGGFHERYFVEGIHYEADATGRPDMPNITLTLDVSPASFWAYNPFD